MTWRDNPNVRQPYEQAMERLMKSRLHSLDVVFISGCLTRALDAATAPPIGGAAGTSLPTREDDIGMLIQTRDLLRSTQAGALVIAQRRLEDYLNRYNR